MASDPDLDFQTILYSTIDAAVDCAVEVHPPHDLVTPFVRIGESSLTDHVIGHEIRVDIHTFSTTEGGHEAKGIMHAIRTALHEQPFSQGSWIFTCCREEDARVFFDEDEEEWHGIQTYRALASLA
jgi:hypothetical protein